jgi:hypothetical protein
MIIDHGRSWRGEDNERNHRDRIRFDGCRRLAGDSVFFVKRFAEIGNGRKGGDACITEFIAMAWFAQFGMSQRRSAFWMSVYNEKRIKFSLEERANGASHP